VEIKLTGRDRLGERKIKRRDKVKERRSLMDQGKSLLLSYMWES